MLGTNAENWCCGNKLFSIVILYRLKHPCVLNQYCKYKRWKFVSLLHEADSSSGRSSPQYNFHKFFFVIRARWGHSDGLYFEMKDKSARIQTTQNNRLDKCAAFRKSPVLTQRWCLFIKKAESQQQNLKFGKHSDCYLQILIESFWAWVPSFHRCQTGQMRWKDEVKKQGSCPASNTISTVSETGKYTQVPVLTGSFLPSW